MSGSCVARSGVGWGGGQVVTYAADTRNVVTVCHGSELLRSLLPHLLEQLELCQKSLSAYLETKCCPPPPTLAIFSTFRFLETLD